MMELLILSHYMSMGSKTNRKIKPAKTEESVKVVEIVEQEAEEQATGKPTEPQRWLT